MHKSFIYKTSLLLLLVIVIMGCNKAEETEFSLNQYLLDNIQYEKLASDLANQEKYFQGDKYSFELPLLLYSNVIYRDHFMLWGEADEEEAIEIAKKEIASLERREEFNEYYLSEVIEFQDGHFGRYYMDLSEDQTGWFQFKFIFYFYIGYDRYVIKLGSVDTYLKDEIIAESNLQYLSRIKRSDVADYDPVDNPQSYKEFKKEYVYLIENEEDFISDIVNGKAGVASELYKLFIEAVKSLEVYE